MEEPYPVAFFSMPTCDQLMEPEELRGDDILFPTPRPPFSIKSPALINAFPAYSPAVRVPASTKPSTEFHKMF
jgi:hypothetical protein